MARSSSDSEGLREEREEETGHGEEDEEDALSLCNFPVNEMKDDHEREEQEQTLLAKSNNQQEEFEFSWGGSSSPSAISEMCAAEDIFYCGQILPLRHSFGSSHEKVNDSVNCGINLYPAVNETLLMSESMDSGFNSFSNRSRSNTSSISSVSTGSDIATHENANSSPKKVNRFRLSHPSPKPQIMRHSNPVTQFSRTGNKSNSSSSSMWDFFKVGLVRTPELQDLNNVSRNSSSGSSSLGTGNRNSKSKKGRKKRLGFLERRGGDMLSGCSCKVSAVVKPIPLNHTNVGTDEQPKKVTAATRKKSKQRRKEKLKQEMSRRRTFDWITKHSHACDINGPPPSPPERI